MSSLSFNIKIVLISFSFFPLNVSNQQIRNIFVVPNFETKYWRALALYYTRGSSEMFEPDFVTLIIIIQMSDNSREKRMEVERIRNNLF